MLTTLETLRLIRPVNCLLAAVGVAVGAYLTPTYMSYYGPVMAAISAFLVCAAGNVVNDLCDVEIDRVNRGQRVLVRGALSRRYAVWLAVALNLLALLNAAWLSWPVTTMVGFAEGLLLIYNLRAKRVPLLGNAIIALLGAMTFITGGLAADASLAWSLPGPLVPALFAFLLHLMREIVKDAEDIEGDRALGILTLPQMVGIRRALIVAFVLHLFLVAATIVPVWRGWYSRYYEVITLYIIDLPLTVGLLSIIVEPTRRRLRLGSAVLKAAMALGAVALILA